MQHKITQFVCYYGKVKKTAQKKADFRKQRFHHRCTFTREKQDFMEERLKEKWSPKQIVGIVKRTGKQKTYCH